MRILLFGASGMIGQGVLRECLLDSAVQAVTSIVRSATGQQHPKLREIVPADFYNLTPLASELIDLDACFFCLGVSSAGMKETEYRRVTYDITLGAAQVLISKSPNMTFIYVSGTGTDSTEKGRVMWARVKGQTENALLRLPFKAVCMFRPAMVMPLHGIRSKTPLYNFLYTALAPVLPLLRRFAPKYITTTEVIGRAMLKVAKNGPPKTILENSDFESL